MGASVLFVALFYVNSILAYAFKIKNIYERQVGFLKEKALMCIH